MEENITNLTESTVSNSAPVAEPIAAASDTQPVTPNTEPAKTEPVAATAAPSEPVDEVNGYLEDPKFKERALGFQRLVTKKTQELATQKKEVEAQKQKVDAYDQFVGSAEFQQYQIWKQNQSQAPQLHEELESAGFTPEQISVVNKLLDSKVSTIAEQQNKMTADMQYKETLIQKEQEINDVAATFPDFWELYDKGLLKPLVKEMVDSGNGTLIDAYNKAKEIEKAMEERAVQKLNAQVATKRNAVTSTPSATADPNTIFATDRNDAFKIAFENAVNGRRVNVKTR